MRLTPLFLLLLAPAALAQTAFTVTTTDDAGPGSLRQAIEDANAHPGPDVIAFALPGDGPHAIRPATALPAITDPVLVDGLTQPGADCTAWPPTLRVELDGSAVTQAPFGLTLAGGGSTVRGLVINGFDGVFNASAGLLIISDDNAVECSFVGTDVTGMAGTHAQQNETGILIDGGNGNVIGGATPDARNVIANSDDDNVTLRGGAAGTVIQGNFIGTDAAGAAPLYTIGGNGVLVLDAPGTVIGGADHDAGVCNRSCNLISGNGENGIEIDGEGGDDAVIQGNFIGTDLAGTAALENDAHGIYVDEGTSDDGTRGHLIGGASDPGVCSRACNLVSGNDSEAIRLDDSSLRDVTIQGNFVGTDATGTAAVPNLGGIKMEGTGHRVGGATAGLGNLISGNLNIGLEVQSTDVVVTGNRIGTTADGAAALGNGAAGVRVVRSGNRIGGTAPGEGNVIAYNGAEGILHARVVSAPPVENRRNPFLGNAIFGNAALGIDLEGDGPTPNDPGDADGDDLANRLQNHPELASAAGTGATLTVAYAVPTAAANATYPLTVEFFLADAEGEEGRAFLGRTTYEAAEAGQPASAAFAPADPVVDGARIVATATDAEGNTSEFSAAVTVAGDATASAPGAERPLPLRLAAITNPFRAATALALTLSAGQDVAVTAYDALGRRVAVLHSGPLSAGTHALAFEAARLPSGVYFVRAVGAEGAAVTAVTLAR